MSPRHSRRILFVAHAFLPDSQSGVEIYTHRLAQELRGRGHRVAVFTPRIRRGRPQNEIIEEEIDGIPVWGVVQNYPYRDLPEALRDPAVDRVFGGILDHFRPDLVSVQTLAGLSLGILDEAAARSIPRVVHLHDAWWSCPSGGQRLHPDGSRCGPVPRERCGSCFDRYRHQEGPFERASRWLAGRLPPALPPDSLHRAFERLPDPARDGLRRLNERAARKRSPAADTAAAEGRDARIESRHEEICAALGTVDRFLSPTRFLRDSLLEDGLPVEDATVLPTGVPQLDPTPPAGGERPLRVLFIGTWVQHKGPHVLAEALAGLEGPIEARAFGPAPFPAYRQDVVALAQGRLEDSGQLPPGEVRNQMDWADVIVLPSIWAENAPLVALEARAAGRPILASRIGGLPELIEEGVDGLLFPPGDAGALRRLLSDRPRIRALASTVRPPRSMQEFTDDVQDHYEDLLT